ncbi:MAG: hypothetical protein ACI86H_002836, partial [bacterium]
CEYTPRYHNTNNVGTYYQVPEASQLGFYKPPLDRKVSGGSLTLILCEIVILLLFVGELIFSNQSYFKSVKTSLNFEN